MIINKKGNKLNINVVLAPLSSMFFKKINNFFRINYIILFSRYRKYKINTFFSTNTFISLLIIIFCYHLFWIIVSKNIKINLKNTLYEYKKNRENIAELSSFSGIKIRGFPFNIKIHIDKISLNLDFIHNIEIKGIVLETGIFNNKTLTLTNLEEITIQPSQKSSTYLVGFNQMPFLQIIKNKKNIIQKILYKDNGYRVIDKNDGEIFDQIEKNILEYTLDLDKKSAKNTYAIDFETVIKIKEESKLRDLNDINIKIAIKGEKNPDNNTITINNIDLRTPIFIINGYGSVIAKKDEKSIFKFNFELKPYKTIIDFIANYFLSKNSLWISKKDIGRYYIAVNNTILPRIKNSSLSETLNLRIESSDSEKKITINELSLENIFESLASSRYDIIYENSPVKKSFYSSNEEITNTDTIEPINIFTKL